jgi:hypothetical protein
MNQQGTPEYSNLTDYPDSLSVGNTLFPMLYIYFMGNETRKKKVGNTYKFEQGLNNYLWSLFSGNGSGIKDVTAKCEKFRTLSKKFSMMFDTVCFKNNEPASVQAKLLPYQTYTGYVLQAAQPEYREDRMLFTSIYQSKFRCKRRSINGGTQDPV